MRTHHVFLIFFLFRHLFRGHHGGSGEWGGYKYLGEWNLHSKRSRHYYGKPIQRTRHFD